EQGEPAEVTDASDTSEPAEPSEPIEEASEEPDAAPSEASEDEGSEEQPARDELAPDEGVRLDWGGEYRFRFNMMSDIPLRPLPRTDPAVSGQLGQSYWGEQWLRLRATLHLLPELRVVGQADVLRGVAFGDLATG